MEPGRFIAEFYRRRDLRHPEEAASYNQTWEQAKADPGAIQGTYAYRGLLPENKDAKILDVGFGNGIFMTACVMMGYTNIEGADFGASSRQGIKNWSPSIRAIHDIESDIGTFLSDKPETYDLIHLAHVIEHIPKYSLLYVLDGIYMALKPGGTLLMRTPNMDGPKPVSSRYVTVTHETGFTGAGMFELLLACNYDNIRFPTLGRPPLSLRQRVVAMGRAAIIAHNRLMHRMFGAYTIGGNYTEELIVTAQRLKRPSLFDPATR